MKRNVWTILVVIALCLAVVGLTACTQTDVLDNLANGTGGTDAAVNETANADNGFTPPDIFNGQNGMTPPDGQNGMTPPDGEQGMPPQGGFGGQGGMTPPDGTQGGITPPDGNQGGMGDIGGFAEQGADANAVDPAEDESEVFAEVEEQTADFVISTQDGAYTRDGNVYTITAAGTYTLTGALTGQIVVDAAEAEVELALNGVTIQYDADSPIKVLAADKVEISAKKGTENIIRDLRDAKTEDTDALGEGAIYAKCDLKLKGSGVLVIEAGYNNGVHTTKDLTIKNLSLKVTAVNNALKGNDSITVESGTLVVISTMGDGMKTEHTDISSKGNQRGTITILDGTLAVYAAGDGLQAAYDVDIQGGDITIFTGTYSAYTADQATTTSYKGVKAGNELYVRGGTLQISSYDDGLHADYGTAFENGATSLGNIYIEGGSVTIAVYSPASATAGGSFGPGMDGQGGMTPPSFNGQGGVVPTESADDTSSGFVPTATFGSMGEMARGGRTGRGDMGGNSFGGREQPAWGNQQTVKGADGIHADNTLTISGGTISIDSAFEGLEATHILVEGGYTTVFATDDGVNASAKISESPTIVVSGGYLDVTVSPSGDTDGIDSNGNYIQTGGVVIARGPNSQNAAALDYGERSTATISGGTLIVLGYASLQTSGAVKSYSMNLHAAGQHTLSVNGETLTFNNAYTYGRTSVYSSVPVAE